mmetsp:Transcript_10073/g.16986  ORF Transcript_10073/g.16986 Transcript_10073/m.16986 type:complete len:156 (+) Transcript_10073:634-1101(+)
MIYCEASNVPQYIIQADCKNGRVTPTEQALFGIKKKRIFLLKNVSGQKEIDFPSDSQIRCYINYDDFSEASFTATESIYALVKNRYSYEYNKDTNKIEKLPIESGDVYSNAMKLSKSIKNKMSKTVHELTENFVKGNGVAEQIFRFYFEGSQTIV